MIQSDNQTPKAHSLADAVLIFQCITADSQDTLITAGHRDWNTTLETQSWTRVRRATLSGGSQCRRVSVTAPGQATDPRVQRSRVTRVTRPSTAQCHVTPSSRWGMSSSSHVTRDSHWMECQDSRVSRMDHWATPAPSVSQCPARCLPCEYKL